MRKMKDKVKRKQVDWYQALFNLEDLKISEDYWLFKSSHPDMSKNRCAYNILKRYYSTTAMISYRKFGVWPR